MRKKLSTILFCLSIILLFTVFFLFMYALHTFDNPQNWIQYASDCACIGFTLFFTLSFAIYPDVY